MNGVHTILVLLALVGADTPQSAQTPTPPPPPNVELVRYREMLLQRQDLQEQSQAALLIVSDPSREAQDLVREGLRRWDRPDVFQALAGALRLRRDQRYVEQLQRALASEQVAIRQAAIDTLAKVCDVATIGKLSKLAGDGAAPIAARQAAVATLGRCALKDAVPALIDLLSGDSASVRQSAQAALEEQTGLNYGLSAAAWQQWWLHHKDLSEASWLANRSAYHADRARRLDADLRRAEDEILRLHQQLYARLPAVDRPLHLQSLAQNEYGAVRVQAIAWVLESLGEADGGQRKVLVGLLLQLSEDGLESVQRQAVLGLEKADDPRAFERLLAVLQGGSIPVRAAAARSLGGYRRQQRSPADDLSRRAITALETALKDPSLVVVAEAVESLGSMRVPEVAPIVVTLLTHAADSVRQAAARALEQVSTPQILESLCAGLEDSVPSVRLSVVAALGRLVTTEKLEERQRMEILRRLEGVLTRDGDPGVRSQAAFTLGNVGTPAELNVLWQRVTATEDARVQRQAWIAMITLLQRSGNWNLVQQWDQTLATQNQHAYRAELLSELRTRWAQGEATRNQVDNVSSLLVQAQLAQRQWSQALPLAMELIKRAPNDAELQRRLRWLLVAANLAIEDKKPADVLKWLKDVEDLLPRARDLAAEFEALRQRVHQAAKS